jgi:hypothetical protein
MSNALALLVVVTVSAFAGLGFLVWMVRKFYWGPTGLPPHLRYGDNESASEDDVDITQG